MFCTTFNQRRLFSKQFIFTGKSNGSFCFYEQNHSIDVDLPKAFYSPSRPQPNIFAWRHSRVFGMRCGEVWWSTVLWGVVVYMRCVVYCEVWWSIVVSVPANTVQYSRSARPGFESLSVAFPQWGLWGGRSFWEYCTTTKVLKHYAEVCCKVKKKVFGRLRLRPS